MKKEIKGTITIRQGQETMDVAFYGERTKSGKDQVLLARRNGGYKWINEKG